MLGSGAPFSIANSAVAGCNPDLVPCVFSDRTPGGEPDDGAKSGSPPRRWAHDQAVFLRTTMRLTKRE